MIPAIGDGVFSRRVFRVVANELARFAAICRHLER
jgi:hypothetical protein